MVGDRGFCSTTSWATWCCNQNCWQLLSFCPENSQTKQPSKIVRQHCPQDTNVHSTQNSKRFKLQYIISRVSLCDSSTRFNLLFMCSLLCGSVAVAGLSASRYEPESLRTWTNRANSRRTGSFSQCNSSSARGQGQEGWLFPDVMCKHVSRIRHPWTSSLHVLPGPKHDFYTEDLKVFLTGTSSIIGMNFGAT